MIWAVAALAAVAVGLGVFAAASMSGGQGQVVRERLSELRQGVRGHRQLQERRRRQERRERIQTLLEALGERVTDESGKRKSEASEFLLHAGYTSSNAAAIYIGSRLVLAAGLAAVVFFGGAFLPFEATQQMLYGATAALLGWMLPFFYVKRKRDARQREIQRALPDALDLLVVCVEAGLGLNQAVLRVSEEMDRISPELGDELTIVSLQIRAGTPRPEALRNLADRTGLNDVQSLVGVLVQTDRFGTSVANALRVHSENLRDKRRQRAEEQAAKTSIKMMFPLVFFIFPAIFVVILGPGLLQIMEVL